ncbi:SPW repeat protein [Allokutzneria oryzae]|uniref:SPW repeat protein n=1 Tax=Allokutzneria oryzae TaxID=1378989 RepID=A0ABV5ZZX5_9PSEU
MWLAVSPWTVGFESATPITVNNLTWVIPSRCTRSISPDPPTEHGASLRTAHRFQDFTGGSRAWCRLPPHRTGIGS